MTHNSIRRMLFSVASTATAAPPVPEYSELMIILGCILCAIICVLGFMTIARWMCLKGSSSVASASPNEVVPGESLKKVVEVLPKLIFKSAAGVTVSSHTADASASAAECVICLSELVDGQVIRILPGCGHVFHVKCIDKWLIGSQSSCCPCCRQVLVVSQCQTCITGVSAPRLPARQPRPEPHFLP